jgi:hypothetical protein
MMPSISKVFVSCYLQFFISSSKLLNVRPKYLVTSASYEEKAKNTNPKVGKMAKARNAQFKILNYNRESCIEIIPHSSLRIPNYFVSLPFNR